MRVPRNFDIKKESNPIGSQTSRLPDFSGIHSILFFSRGIVQQGKILKQKNVKNHHEVEKYVQCMHQM